MSNSYIEQHGITEDEHDAVQREYHEGDDHDDEPHGSHDLSDDAEALASAGFGTDEDYGSYGGDGDDY